MDILLYMSRMADSKLGSEGKPGANLRPNFDYEVDYEDLEYEIQTERDDDSHSDRVQNPIPRSRRFPKHYDPKSEPNSVEGVFASALNVT